MPHLFLERTFETPLSASGVLAMAEQGHSCFGLHGVEWRASLLSAGGRKMLCRFHARDAESVRIALRSLGADVSRLWPGSIHDAPGFTAADHATASVLVEREFDDPVPLEEIRAVEAEGWCLEAYHVTFLRTYVSADRKRMICLYRAPDAESVRLAQRHMKMPAQDIWAFTAIGPGD